MNYWILKSEPEAYGFQDLLREGRTAWDGVRNYGARNNLRAMKEGDIALFYHSITGKEVVGICRIIREYYPDPSAEKGDWSAVDVAPVKALNRPVRLKEIKAREELSQIGLVRLGRLSVVPITQDEFEVVLSMGETKL